MSLCMYAYVGVQMKERGPGVRGYPFVLALIISFAVFTLAVLLRPFTSCPPLPPSSSRLCSFFLSHFLFLFLVLLSASAD